MAREKTYLEWQPWFGDLIKSKIQTCREYALLMSNSYSYEHTEQSAFEWPGKRRHFPVGPAWIPWASQEVSLPTPDLPSRYFMAVFDLGERRQPGEDGSPVDNDPSP